MPLFLALFLGCKCEEPVWSDSVPDQLFDGPVTVDLSSYSAADVWEVEQVPGMVAEIDGSQLTITPESTFNGEATLTLTARTDCGMATSTVRVTTEPDVPGDCLTTFRWDGTGQALLAGSFNDWEPQPFDEDGTLSLPLQPGPHTYKIVADNGFGDQQWMCDPNAELIQCDAGYKEPWETDWSHTCSPGVESCNSMIVVPPCDAPTLTVDDVQIDGDRVQATISTNATSGTATLDGEPLDVPFSGGFSVDTTVTPGRHTLRFEVDGAHVQVPFWTDGFDEDAGLLYFAFIDRLHNGDTSNDLDEGATATLGGYEGGDVQGLIDLLPYLDDLGVTVLWLSNLQGNASGGWAGDCGQTYAGYHAYWPDAALDPEEHFADEALIHALIDQAHDRGMRVIMDWVANHVHEDHPYYAEHPEWFNADGNCKDVVDGQQNWDRIPESCAFASYLPDIDYTQPEPLNLMVEDALWWAETYDLDGFRVDAVKHMPHAVTYNLTSTVNRRLEHAMDFYTVGETFDSYDRIKAYIGEDQLDGQFDFDLYRSIRSSFINPQAELGVLWDSYETSRTVYGDAPMSTFLGNHDVLRFVSDATEGYVDPCQGGQIAPAPVSDQTHAYESLRLAWTFLLTMPGRPLVYYGDEIGMPGRGDPDNRQPLSWHVPNLDQVQDVEDLAAQVGPQQAQTVRLVRDLASVRPDHPALYTGDWQEWWREYDVFGYARRAGDSKALVILNRSAQERTLTNGLAFAQLPTDGTYTDLLTGDTFVAGGDSISVTVPARGARVLIAP